MNSEPIVAEVLRNWFKFRQCGAALVDVDKVNARKGLACGWGCGGLILLTQ